MDALPQKSLLTVYLFTFLRPLLDYSDSIYDQPYNSSFCVTLEPAQYKAALAITDSI